jgi:hypothetical protein
VFVNKRQGNYAVGLSKIYRVGIAHSLWTSNSVTFVQGSYNANIYLCDVACG